tara:strand:+ start:400 stop:588 length:189 start_codon:yes stop_codon:yes gene_type:complete
LDAAFFHFDFLEAVMSDNIPESFGDRTVEEDMGTVDSPFQIVEFTTIEFRSPCSHDGQDSTE